MANEEREEYPEAPMKRVPRGAEISPLDVFRTADPLQERIQKDATPKQTPRQKNKKTGYLPTLNQSSALQNDSTSNFIRRKWNKIMASF